MIVLYAIKVMIAIVLIPMELIMIFYDYQLNLKFNFIIQTAYKGFFSLSATSYLKFDLFDIPIPYFYLKCKKYMIFILKSFNLFLNLLKHSKTVYF